MSINLEGKKCAICGAYLFPEDDVAFCPTCGAPHHRECYKKAGKCGFEELHGTENQYSEPIVESKETKAESKAEEKAENKCIVCKKSLPEDTRYCPYCGAPTRTPVTFETLSPFVALDGSTEIEDGVTVKEVTPIIATNQLRYISRFIKKDKLSWNWAAFLFPHVWFGFRKMFSASWAFSVGFIISSLLTMPFNMAITKLPGYADITGGSAMIGRFIMENVHLVDRSVLLLAAIGSFLDLALMVLGGLIGDKIYKKHVIRVAKEIKESDDKESVLLKKGKIALFVPVLVFAMVNYLPSLIFALIGV